MKKVIEAKVEGRQDLVRRSDSPAVIRNTNSDALQSYKASRQKFMRLNELEEQVNSQSKELSEIKCMLKQLLEAIHHGNQ